MAKGKRALVIGGSMSGLLAALALERARLAGRRVRARRRAARRARRRHRGAAGAEGVLRIARARCRPRSRHRGRRRGVMFARDGPRDASRADRADHDGVGPRVLPAQSRASRRRIITAARNCAAWRAARAGRRGAFRRRLGRGGRCPGRRRRHPLDRAPAISARGRAALCGLHGVARADRRKRVSAGAACASCSRISRSACRPNEQMLGYPVAGPDNDLRPGHRRYNFVWYRPASEERELPRLLTDDSGRTHVLSIPPPLIARDVIAAMRAGCRTGARAAVQRDGRLVRAAVPAADLRSGSAAHGVRPRRDPGRCRVRGAPACRRGRRQGRRGCAGARRRRSMRTPMSKPR